MGRFGTSAKSASFPVALTEADIRHLCGAAAYQWGDIWQREDHVVEPSLEARGLSGGVLGEWRRLDSVTVSAAGGHVRSTCTCNEGGICRHAAALLLQWVRHPETFVYDEPDALGAFYLDELDAFDDDLDEVELSQPAVETSTQEFARLLGAVNMQELREIARKRGARVTARNKAELVEQLAAALSDGENVDSAVAGLKDDERLTLEVSALVRVGATAASQSIGNAYKALGGKGTLKAGVPAAVTSLVDLGLVFPADRYAVPSSGYVVPQVVLTRLASDGTVGPIGQMLGTRDSTQVIKEMNRSAGGRSQGTGLSIVELFQVIVFELVRGRIAGVAAQLSPAETAGVPQGWRRDSTAYRQGQRKGSSAKAQQYSRLLPLPPLLRTQDLHHLSRVAGQPPGMVDFALLLLRAFGIVELHPDEGGYKLLVAEDRLQEILGLGPFDLVSILAQTWLGSGEPVELGMVASGVGPIQLNYTYNPYSYAGRTLPQPAGDAVRRMVARVIGRLAASESGDGWYDFGGLLDLLWNVSPMLLSPPGTGQPLWWFSTRKAPDTRLNLDERADWESVLGPVVQAILTGPMTWLGLVDVAMGKDRVLAFRPRPRAATFAAQRPEEDVRGDDRPCEIELRDGRPVVLVPAGRSGTVLYSLLHGIGELVDASPHGLEFRLRPDRLQSVFDLGMSAANVAGALAQYGDERLAQTLGPTLEEWWSRYGVVRLYDDLTLIELGDDLLLPEVLASSRLRDALLHTFSPRLVAVRPADVDGLVAQLSALGYSPRVIEEV